MTAHFKHPTFESRKWRESARDKPCTLRLPGCDGGGETTVLAHLRYFGWGGMGQKPHDFLAVYACDNCHKIQEAKDPEGPCGFDDLLRALGETLDIHHAEGRIK